MLCLTIISSKLFDDMSIELHLAYDENSILKIKFYFIVEDTKKMSGMCNGMITFFTDPKFIENVRDRRRCVQ